MRKDVKLGLAVGVVLVGVIITYLIVAATHNDKSRTPVNLAGGEQAAQSDPKGDDDGPAVVEVGGSQQHVEPAPATRPADPPHGAVAAASTRPADAPPAVADGSGSVWMSLLAGRSEPAPAPAPAPSASVTRTPPIPPLNAVDTQPIPRPGTLVHDPAAPPSVVIPPAPSPSTRPSRGTHIVREGENFWTIAQSEYHNATYYANIQRANPNVAPNKLRPGMKLVLPDIAESPAPTPGGGIVPAPPVIPASSDRTRPSTQPAAYHVRNGDTLYSISKTQYGRGDMADAIYQLNRQVIGADPNRLSPDMVLQLPQRPVTTARR